MEHSEKKHKRRVRYSGTHPKKYNEKYKELQPDKYPDTIKRVKQKGSTPAGMHLPIMVTEIIDFLDIQPGEKGLDATLGYGGHALEMLKHLQHQGHLYALDVDPFEIIKSKKRLQQKGYNEDILTIKQLNFVNIDQVAYEVGPFDFILADLGVSSMQIDNPKRGFSYKKEGPLDLRLNPNKGISASERLQKIRQDELEGMLVENADEPYAKEISKAIVKATRDGNKIETTTALRTIIEAVLKPIVKVNKAEVIRKSCQRTFQALRIDVNNELEVLSTFLEKLPNCLAKDGRVAVLSFHSGEDRLVKKAFKRMYQEGIYKEISSNVIRPSSEECRANPRAKSTKMRWAIKA